MLPLLPDAPRYLFIEKGDEKACKKGWLGFPLLRCCLSAMEPKSSSEAQITLSLRNFEAEQQQDAFQKKNVSYSWRGCAEYKQETGLFPT